MRLLLGKRPLLAVRPEAVAGDCNCVNVVSIVVGSNEVGMGGERHPRIYWGKFHPRRWRRKRQDCRLWGNNNGECHPQRWQSKRQYCRLWGNEDGECMLCNGALEYFGEVNNGLLLGVDKLIKWGGRGCIGEGLCQGPRCNDGCVEGEGFWHRTLVQKNCTVLAVRSDLVFGI